MTSSGVREAKYGGMRLQNSAVFFAFVLASNLASNPHFCAPVLASVTRTAYESGLVLAEEDHWQAAVNEFTKAIKANPNDTDAYVQRARCYSRLKNYSAVIDDCTAALKLSPRKARAFGYRGLAYLCLGRIQPGIADTEQAVALDRPDELDVLVPTNYLNLAKALNMTRHGDIAAEYAARGHNLDFIKKAKEAREMRQLDLAFNMVGQAIKANPAETSAFYVRGILHNNKGEYDKAIADFTTAIKQQPDLVPAYYFRADAYTQSGQYKLALHDYDRIIALNPRLVVFRLVTESGRLRDHFFGKDDEIVNLEDIHYLRGKVRAEAGDKLGALQDYETALKLDSADREAAARIAEIQSTTGHNKAAIKSLSSSVKAGAVDWQTLASRAHVYEMQGDNKKALADYSSIISANAKEPGAYFLRAQLLEKTGDLPGAIKDYSQMIALKPDDDDAYKCRADCLLRKGDYQKAVEDFSYLIKHDPQNSASIYASRAIAYEKSGQKDLAAKDRILAREKALRASGH